MKKSEKQKVFLLGVKAYENGMEKFPAKDKELLNILKDKKIAKV